MLFPWPFADCRFPFSSWQTARQGLEMRQTRQECARSSCQIPVPVGQDLCWSSYGKTQVSSRAVRACRLKPFERLYTACLLWPSSTASATTAWQETTTASAAPQKASSATTAPRSRTKTWTRPETRPKTWPGTQTGAKAWRSPSWRKAQWAQTRRTASGTQTRRKPRQTGSWRPGRPWRTKTALT